MKIGDLCPECGEAAVVNEEGCPGNLRPSAMPVGLVSADPLRPLGTSPKSAMQSLNNYSNDHLRIWGRLGGGQQVSCLRV
jgi:hypothetical protein